MWGLVGAGEAESLTERLAAEVRGWGVAEVGRWLEGLGPELAGPRAALERRGLRGAGLLLLSASELVRAGVPQLGLRHLVLSATEQLNALLYSCERETAASQALQTAVAARALQVAAAGRDVSLAEALAAVSAAVHQTKGLLGWLDRRPLEGLAEYGAVRTRVAEAALALVAEAQRTPPSPLRLAELAEMLGAEAEALVRRDDVLLLSPAYLERLRLRRPNDADPDWPDVRLSSASRGAHLVAALGPHGPHLALKPGDEIVKVGPQIVIGWQTQAVETLLRLSSSTDIDLIVKKRPSSGKSAPSTPRLGNRLRPPPVAESPAVVTPTPERSSSRFRSRDRQRLRSTSTGDVSSDEAADEASDSLGRKPTVVRRASISGGSPTLERVSRHLERTSSLHPTNPTEWVVGPARAAPAPLAAPVPLTTAGPATGVLSARTFRRFSTSSEDSEDDDAGEVFLNHVPPPPTQLISDEAEVMPIDEVCEVIEGEELSRLRELLLTDRPDEDEWDPKASFRSLADKSRFKLARFFGAAPPSGQEEIGLVLPPSQDSVAVASEAQAQMSGRRAEVWDRAAEEVEPSEMRGWAWRSRLPGEPQTVSKWRKRWLVLQGPLLYVFKTETSLEAEGVVSLRSFEAKMGAEGYRGSKKSLLSLSSTSSKVSYLFYCDDAQSRALWLRHIGAARIELCQRPAAHGPAQLPFGGAFWRPTAQPNAQPHRH